MAEKVTTVEKTITQEPPALAPTTTTQVQPGPARESRADADCLMIVEVILAIIFPPLAVGLARGCGCELLLNILLTLCGWLPGVIHALYVCLECGREPVEEVHEVTTVVPTNDAANRV